MAELPPSTVPAWADSPAIVREAAAGETGAVAWLTADLAVATAETPAAAAAEGPPANPPLAMGLAGVNDWAAEQPFIDVMKTARPWTGHLPGQWGGWDEKQLAAGGWLDEAGWLRAMPPELTSVSTLMLTEQDPASASLAGRYRLTWSGKGSLRVEGRVANVVRKPGEIWFDYTPGEGFVLLTIDATDPEKTGDYVRDIAVVKAENVDLHAAGAIFNPDWIARIEDLRALRFMDWMQTNGSKIAAWEERPLPGDYTWSWRGVPVEVMVALANEVGADPWFTLPHQATDAHMRAFAEYVRDHLDPRRKAYVEYSNEVWNWTFEQSHWAAAAAKARWGWSAGDDAWMQFVGMRGAQMATIWKDVFGAAAEDRLVAVVSTQTGWLGLEEPLLEAPLWVAEDPETNRAPAKYFDAFGVTAYFGHRFAKEKAPQVLDWIAESRAAAARAAEAKGLSGPAAKADAERHQFDLANARAEAELRDGSVTGDPDDSIAALVDHLLATHAETARRNDLALVMYEGGTHLVLGHEWHEDPDLTAFLAQFNYGPEMAGLYETLFEGWRSVGGTMFNAYVDVTGQSRWGSWGALRFLDDDNPRWDALMRYNRAVPAWWEERPAGAFDNGVTRRGTAAADEITGTPWGDILAGGAGDDHIVAGGGADRIHGGAGTDTAVLPGVAADYALTREGDIVLARAPGGTTRLVAVEEIRFDDDETAALATGDLPLGDVR